MYGRSFLLVAILMFPAMVWAGGNTMNPVPELLTPALGDAGLIALGVSLIGVGVAFLRKY